MIAININTHPMISYVLSTSLRMTKPASTDITDSRLIIKDATVGCKSFWAIICNVKAMPLDMAPAYIMGSHAFKMFSMEGVSNISMQTPERIPQTRN